jgi:ferredoxin
VARLTIDNIEIEIEDGATVLDAAAKAGAEIPTLCYTRQTGGLTSCMLCVVKDAASGQMLPACSAKADDGMAIDTRGDDVMALRRETLVMLLSEHAGDCEAPCTRICPASLDIPRMMRLIAGGDDARPRVPPNGASSSPRRSGAYAPRLARKAAAAPSTTRL